MSVMEASSVGAGVGGIVGAGVGRGVGSGVGEGTGAGADGADSDSTMTGEADGASVGKF